MADVDILILTQKALNDQIDKAGINHGKANSETKQGKKYYATRIQSLEKLWQAFTETHIAIWSTENGADSEYVEGNLYEETEELYINLKSRLSQELEESFPTLPHTGEQPSSQATHPPKRETRLPPIQIPTFDGNYKSWHTFHDLFNSLIHKDPNLSKVQKLHYLKLSVTGEPERLLRQFEVIDTNYTKAWELLQKRFDNKRVLVNTHLKSLLSQPAIKTESAHAIRSLLDLTEESLHELKYLGLPVEHWDAILIYNLVQRLPSETHQLWEHEQGNKNELPTYADLSVFLETRFRTLEALQECQNNKAQNRSPSYIEARVRTREPRSGYKPDSHISATQKKHAHKNAYSFLNKPHTCAMCKQNHTLFHCTSFRKLHPKERINFIQRNKLCKNCLAAGHNLNGCPSQKTCLQCQKRHNSLLHLNQPSETNTTQNQRQAEVKHTELNGSNEPAINTFFSTNVSQALLSTALVNIESPNGQIYTLRALIDSGSQVSFITEAASKRLKLQTKPTHVEVTGLGKIQTAHVNKHTTFKLKSLHTRFEISVNALILRRITDFVPADTINITNLLYLQHLQLADPRFHTPGQIDVLLGADIYAEIIESGVIKGSPGDPTAQCTHLGWILMGKLKGKNKSSKVESLTVQIHPDCQLEQQLKRFWEIEEVPTIIAHPDNVLCERLYAESHKRLSQGQYQVKLPFRQPDGPDLGHTRQMAVKQYLQLEKRFEKQPELHAQYKKFIQEYLRLGHMVEIKPNTAEQTETERISHYYLPHHVIKESSTTKLRVVFNASAKSSNGRSLNEQMLAGPTIQPTLWATILKWRLYKIAFTADIEKMYRMVQMHPDHTDFQRIVWRDSRSEPIKDYKLTTVTFGTTSAPFLAIRTLHQLSKDEQDNYPLSAQSLKTDFYVDDLLTGAHNVKTGLTLQNELISVLSKAGFNLRKWTANHPELIKNIPLVDRENNSILDLSEKDTIKTLGLQWHPASDEFSFKVTPSKKETHFTKRTILSETASLFDPLGWLAPIIIIAKIFIQTLWLSKCSWDQILPDTTTAKWAEFMENLNDIDEIRIPRWIQYSLTSTNLEVHGFCDASEKAFGSVVYLRIINENGAIFTHLFTSKTRVAPTKTISLPRLELCRAVLLARVIKQIKIDLNLTDCSTFAWSGSEVTLSWIQKQPSSWKTFVAHRVAEIQEVIHPRSWRDVPSKSNPADCATRGIYPRELIQSKLWWNGPSWLQEPTEKWPEQPSFNKCPI